MASSARIDELLKKYNENQRRYFAPLANEYRKSGDLELAIQTCEEHLPHQPGHMSGHIVYGQALYEAGRLDDARDVFETALSLDPENLIALRHLGDIASRQDDRTIARRWYERVLEADPRNEEIQGLIAGLDAASGSHGRDERRDAPVDEQTGGGDGRADAESFAPVAPAFHGASDDRRAHDLDETLAHGMPAIPAPSARSDAPAEADFRASGDGHAETSYDIGALEPISLDDIVPTAQASRAQDEPSGRADGFEATEFEAPAEQVKQAPGLQSAYEDEVSTQGMGASFTPLVGLEGHHQEQPVESPAEAPQLDPLGDALGELSLDEGLTLPPHGDPVAPTMPSTGIMSELPSFDEGDEFAVPGTPASARSSLTASEGEPASESIPVELPPEVIAAEAELTDLDLTFDDAPTSTPADEVGEREVGDAWELPDSAEGGAYVPAASSDLPSFDEMDSGPPQAALADEPLPRLDDAQRLSPHGDVLGSVEPDQPTGQTDLAAEDGEDGRESSSTQGAPEAADAPSTQRPFVTETMAELYLKQGFREQALSVYQQLSATNPDDDRLAARVQELLGELETAATVETGPNVRDFFARLASRRPGERGAASAPPADTDFDSPAEEYEPAMEAAPAVAPSPSPSTSASAASASSGPGTVPSAVERAATTQVAGGSIDALFGNRATTTSEDSAASALSQAFGAEGGDASTISGNPARRASGELSLDSVFRDGSPRGRASQGFSFDQFFSQTADAGKSTGGARDSQEIATPGEPAEKSADDIEQFNSWLQGLKQR